LSLPEDVDIACIFADIQNRTTWVRFELPLPAADPAATQRVGGLVELPALLRELGADPQRVFAAAQVDPGAFEHIDARLPSAGLDRLISACLQHTGCPHFWLLVGQRWSITHFGRIGEMMQCAPTVGDALRSFSVLQHLNSDIGAAFVLEYPDSASFGYAIYGTMHYPEQLYDAAMAVACNVMRALCRVHWTASEVLLARPTPRDVTPYRQCFRAPVRFEQVYSAVRFSPRWLVQPSLQPDAKRHQLLLQEVGALDHIELLQKLQRALRVLLIKGYSSGDELAQILSMHRRTLNRRLQEQGTTFQKLLDEVRLDVARQLLLHTNTPIEGIASALCYADVSAFMHAFRRWTGTTPAHFRQEQHAG
jgi:AraC-like DNA-binding protein